jgi:hypothetical protein
MPSTSQKQHNFMEAIAHSASFAKKAGVPQSVGKEFSAADKGLKFGAKTRTDRQEVNKPKTDHGKQALFKKGGDMKSMKKMSMGGDTTGMSANKQSKGITKEAMGKVKTAAPSRDGIAEKGRTKGMMPKMAGTTTGMKRGGMTKKKMMK